VQGHSRACDVERTYDIFGLNPPNKEIRKMCSLDEGLGIWYSCHRNNYYFSMRLDSMDFALELVVKRCGC
jgi:hypothetical protein